MTFCGSVAETASYLRENRALSKQDGKKLEGLGSIFPTLKFFPCQKITSINYCQFQKQHPLLHLSCYHERDFYSVNGAIVIICLGYR